MDYNRVTIGTIHLTEDGTLNGRPCRVIIPELNQLLLSTTGAMVQAADRTPYAFIVPNTGQGVPITLNVNLLLIGEFNSIKNYIDATAPPNLIDLRINGLFGNWLLKCLPNYPEVIQMGEHSGDRVQEVIYRFIVQTIEEESSSSSS